MALTVAAPALLLLCCCSAAALLLLCCCQRHETPLALALRATVSCGQRNCDYGRRHETPLALALRATVSCGQRNCDYGRRHETLLALTLCAEGARKSGPPTGKMARFRRNRDRGYRSRQRDLGFKPLSKHFSLQNASRWSTFPSTLCHIMRAPQSAPTPRTATPRAHLPIYLDRNARSGDGQVHPGA